MRVRHVGLVALVVVSLGAGAEHWPGRIHGSKATAADAEVARQFADPATTPEQRYRALFTYFVTGFVERLRDDGASAAYEGAPSSHGARIDRMEGFTRMVPLVSAWLSGGRPAVIATRDGQVDLLAVVKRGLLAGTDPESPGYWGDIGDVDQRLCEAADVALSLWLLRDVLWPELDRPARDRIMAWLLQVNGKEVTDNNWHLFPVLVDAVAHSFGYPTPSGVADEHYRRLRQFAQGNGWFTDGPGGAVDFYNAWAIHYALFWLGEIDPSFDRQFLAETSRRFLATYPYLLSPAGAPITGRSICYRMAVTAPLTAGARRHPEMVSPGMARHATDAIWEHFLASGAVADGNVTQGYCAADLRFVDNYTGPASCLWSLRSLVVAFYWPEGSAFWTAPAEPLPVERADYRVSLPAFGWTIVGHHDDLDVRIERAAGVSDPVPVDDYSVLRRAADVIRGGPHRPDNHVAKYGMAVYSARAPFCGCPG